MLSAVAVVAVVAGTAPAPLHAVTNDKLAYLTFSAPVQVPGVTLNAGTYRFHLTDPSTGRKVLQVMSNDGAIVYAMFHTMPDGRTKVTDDPIVSYRETPAGVPPAIKSIFYGGEHQGYEFVYPKGGPVMTPEVVWQPEIRYTPLPAAPVREETVIAAEPEAAPEIVVETTPMPAEEPAPLPPSELPHTATPLPLFAVGGLTSLLVGLGLGVLRRKTN
jgi:LPXTG-motif cell wall-anchored protein